MKIRYLLTFLSMVLFLPLVMAQSSVEGKVIDDNEEAVPIADVVLYKDGVLVSGAQTDFDGNYSVNNVNPGTYSIEVTLLGYQSTRMENVVLIDGKTQRVDFTLTQGTGINLEDIVVIEYRKPLVEQDNTTSGGTLTSEDIANLPTKNIASLAALNTPGASVDSDGGISMRGTRTSGTDYYLDGIRISGNSIPQSEIEQMTTLVGGIPASYGDVTGGAIAITSKGPSGSFRGGLEVETSEFLDKFGYNLVSGYLSGPIVKNSDEETVFGFRISGQYTHLEDDNQSILGRYYANEETIREIEANPLQVVDVGSTDVDYNTIDDAYFKSNGGNIGHYATSKNDNDRDYVLTARLDWRIAKSIDISLSGNYNNSKNQFTPSLNSTTPSAYNWAVFNWMRNPYSYNDIYRANFRFRHRLDGNREAGDDAVSSPIRNASYSIQAGFQRAESKSEDQIHEENFWDYGYIGKFDQDIVPVVNYEIVDGELIPFHAGNGLQFAGYEAGDLNPVLAKFNEIIEVEDSENNLLVTDFNTYNGTRLSKYRSSYELLQNVGQVYNRFSRGQSDRYTIDARVGFDFVPSGKDKGRHTFEFGFLYEQRFSSNWSLRPDQLWNAARIEQNRLLQGVDTAAGPIGTAIDPGTGLEYNLYNARVVADESDAFFFNARKALGVQNSELINIDGLTPDQMNLEWFNVRELAEFGGTSPTLDFYGYTFDGKKLSNRVNFDDFFASGPNGQKFEVAAFKPTYIAGYFQDKFSYKDIIFRLGLRIERYDANTKVLKDPLTLYDIMDANEYFTINSNIADEVRAAGVGDDFLVYVNDENDPRSVEAYRVGEQWYNKDGEQVNDGLLIFGEGGVVTPYYRNRNLDETGINSSEFDVDGSFRDFKPETNFSPRLSFSFPISENSNFYANYDILHQRPTSGVISTALDYYVFETRASSLSVNNNPNLKPVKTTQYEIGFNQKISNSSAIKFAAYYKEERSNIQVRRLRYVATTIGDYTTYDNIDFATTKGFSFTYDMRRTGNVSLLMNYTLGFADGTGSDPTSQIGIVSKVNVRTLTPLAFDERHRFNLVFDFRYGNGKSYNGPIVFGSPIFQNAGLNIQGSAVSGRPYTRRVTAVQFGGEDFDGSINGARLPWRTNLDLRIDKDFKIGKEVDGINKYSINIYFRVQNLLNTRNIVQVYSASGSASDDGYLATSRGEAQIETFVDGRAAYDTTPNEYIDQYNLRMENPGFYALPRRMYLGAIFNF